MKKVLAITAIRSEYYLQRSILQAIADHPELELSLVVTGAHLSPLHGYTVKEVEADGFPIVERIENTPRPFIVFCDDLTFDAGEAGYKALKVMLDGSIAGAAGNVVIYATSNRRHLLPEYFAENLETRHVGDEVHPGESVEEKISLSERFGLWISFYPFAQDDYLHAVAGWLAHFGVAPAAAKDVESRTREALQFALQRGSRSGRVAWQFAKAYAGARALRAR